MTARKSGGNVVATYIATNITAYCNSSELSSTIERLDTTDLADTAKTTIAGDAEWSVSLSGMWDNAIDTLLGPDAVTPGTARTFSLAYTGSGATKTYTWTSAVEIQDWKITAATGNFLEFSCTLACSGAPTLT